jgi:hypothetical protein
VSDDQWRVLIFRLGDEEYLLAEDQRCTAPTVTGRRCRNPVWMKGQEWWYPWEDNPDRVEFDNPDALAKALSLRCPVHLGISNEQAHAS